MLVLLDSNVLLRMVKADDADHGVAVQALRWLKDHGHRATVVPQCVYEF